LARQPDALTGHWIARCWSDAEILTAAEALNADKDAVIAAVRALGFDPANDNEADALALLDWALK
jgi:hypothetical protein